MELTNDDKQGIPDSSEAAGSFGGVYDRYAPQGVRYAYSFLGNLSDSEEVVQEAFCRLLVPARRRRFEDDDSGFGAIFFTTVKNLSIDQLRRRRRHPAISLDGLPAAEVDPQATELEPKVRQLVDELPESWRDALKLKVDGGLSYQEIAEVLSCTRDQVRTWIYRARRRLADELAASGVIAGKDES